MNDVKPKQPATCYSCLELAFQEGWKVVTKDFFSCFLVLILFFALNVLLQMPSLLGGFFSAFVFESESLAEGLSNLVMNMMTGVLSTLFGGVIMAGPYVFFLKRLRGESHAPVTHVFDGFGSPMLQLVLANVIITILSVALSIFIFIPAIGLPYFFDNWWLLVVTIPLIVLFLLFLSSIFLFVIPLVIDQKLDFWTAIQKSVEVGSSHLLIIVALIFLLVVVNSLGVLFCFVGIVFTVPFSFGVEMSVYDQLFCQRSIPPAQDPA